MPYFIRDNPQYVQGFEVDTYSPVERVFTRAGRTNEAMAESLGIFLQRKYPEIPNTEKAAIYHYTQGNRSAYRELNNQLRKGKLSEFNEAFSELLSKGLSKLQTEEATVYRTIRLNKTNLEVWKQQAACKAETTFQGFTSTSDCLDVVNELISKKSVRIKKNETDVLLVIKSKTGHRISEFSKFPEQRELLFDKGIHLRYESVIDVNGQIIFEMTEI